MEEQIRLILHNLLAPDNDQRNLYEESFWQLVNSDPSNVIQCLFNVIETSPNKTHQMLSLILLKHIFVPFKQEVFNLIPENYHNFIQNKLISYFSANIFPETNLNYLSTAVASIASVYIHLNSFENFIPEIYQIILTYPLNIRAPAIDCAIQVITDFKDTIQLDQTQTLQIITMTLQDNSMPAASVAMMRFIYTIIPDDDIPAELQSLSNAIPSLISQLQQGLLSQMLLNLAIFIAKKPKFVFPILDDLIPIVIAIFTDKNQDEGCRINAIEVACQIITRTVEEIKYLPNIVEALFSILEETDDSSFSPCEDDTQMSDIAYQHLCTMGGVQNLQPLFTQIILNAVKSCINSENWCERYASLKALECLISTSHAFIEEKAEIISALVERFSDSSPVCRVASFLAFSQGCVFFKEFIKLPDVLSAFLTVMSNETEEKALIAEIFALSLLCEQSSVEDLRESHQDLVNTMILLSNEACPLRLNAILRCICTFLRSLGEEMAAFYPIIIEELRNIITVDNQEGDPSLSLLRARAIECFGYLCCCVDKERLQSDSQWFISTVIDSDWNFLTQNEIVQLQTTLSSIVSMSVEVSGEEFIIPVIEKLLEIVQNRPKFNTHQQFDPFMRNMSREMYNFLMDSSFLEMRKEELQVYESALSALKIIMKASGQIFVPYIQQFCKAAAPACFYFPLPQTQIIALDCLKESATLLSVHSIQHASQFILHMCRLVYIILEQPELKPTVIVELFKTLSFALETLIRIKSADEDSVNEILEHIPLSLKAIISCAETNGMCSEMELAVTDVLLLLFQHFEQKTCAFFESNLAQLLPMDPSHASIVSLNCWTSMLRCQENLTPEKISAVFDYICNSCQNQDYNIAASSFFCMGMLVDTGILDDTMLERATQISFAALSVFDQQGEFAKTAIDGVTFLLTYLINTLDDSATFDMISQWFTHLPFTTPTEKSRTVYLTLADQLSHNFIRILMSANPEKANEDPQHDSTILVPGIHKFVEIILATYMTDLIDLEIDQRFKRIFTDIASDPICGPVISLVISQFDSDYSKILHNYTVDQ